MFKLKKILNKHNNAPEIEIHEMEGTSIGKIEHIYALCDGALYANVTEEELATLYVGFREISEYDEMRKLECFRVTPDMIFEVNCSTTTTAGAKFKMMKTSSMYGYDYISIVTNPDGYSDGYVVDVSNQKNTGKVLVRFHCKQ